MLQQKKAAVRDGLPGSWHGQDIRDFILVNDLDKNECLLLAKEVEEKVPLKTKLQDSLLILYKMNASMELIFMIKNKLKKYNK